ncbi:MAG: carboxypeptidase-like regulatory domain-containing protein [Chitinivibrionales bacterium]|nr:carboxypeptidase-like regulatory domain-containing protein [Chitinivibrionales bacterium]
MDSMNKVAEPRKDLNFELDPARGHIRGKITDTDKNGIDASLILIREISESTFSDAQGNFVLINIPPAFYTLVIEHEEYAPLVINDLPIFLGDNPGRVFVLRPCVIPDDLH